MSLIIASITKGKSIIVKADSRCTKLDGSIVKENLRKIHRNNNKCITGFAGNIATEGRMLKHLLEKFPNPNEWNPITILHECYNYKCEGSEDNPLEVLVCGFDNNNNPFIYMIYCGEENKFYDFTPKGYGILGVHDAEQYFSYTDNLNELFLEMDRCIKEVSTYNNTVNDNIYTEILINPNDTDFQKLLTEGNN